MSAWASVRPDEQVYAVAGNLQCQTILPDVVGGLTNHYPYVVRSHVENRVVVLC